MDTGEQCGSSRMGDLGCKQVLSCYVAPTASGASISIATTASGSGDIIAKKEKKTSHNITPKPSKNPDEPHTLHTASAESQLPLGGTWKTAMMNDGDEDHFDEAFERHIQDSVGFGFGFVTVISSTNHG